MRSRVLPRRLSGSRRAAILLALWLLPLIAALAFWQIGGETFVELGVGDSNDKAVMAGFYDPEQNQFYNYSYRWSTFASTIHIAQQRGPALVVLRGATAPNGTAVTVTLNNQAAIRLPLNTGDLELRRYWIYAPNPASATGALDAAISATPGSNQIEERDLGMLVDSFSAASMRWTPAAFLPPLLVVAAFYALAVGLMLLAWQLGMPALSRQAMGVLTACALALAWGLKPAWVQPWLSMGTVALWAVVALVFWSRRLARDVEGTRVVLLPSLYVGALALAGLIPIYSWYRYGFTRWELWLLPAMAGVALIWPFLPAKRRYPIRHIVGAALALMVLVYGVKSYIYIFDKDYADDFKALFNGTRAYWRGQPLYELDAIRANVFGNTYKYPPFFVFVLGPLKDVAFGPAIQIWRAAGIALLVIALIALWRSSGRRLRSWSTLGLLGIALLFQPINDSLRYGQADMLILLGAALAAWALSRGRWGWFGAAIALPTMIKLYPAYLLLHGVARRSKRALIGWALACAALGIAAIAILGWGLHVEYLRDVLPISGGGTGWVENQTFNGFFNRLTSGTIGLQPETGGWQRWAAYLLSLALTAATFLRARRLTPEAGFGLWIIALLAVLPATWIHYEVLLIVPLYQALVRLEQQPAPWSRGVWYLLCWGLLCHGNQWTFFARINHGPIWALILSYKLYGLLILWGIAAFDRSAYQAVASGSHLQQPATPAARQIAA